MKLLLPLLLLVIGTGSGIGAGVMLKPAAPEGDETATKEAVHCVPGEAHVTADVPKDASAPASYDETAEPAEYAKLNNQFVVPVVADDQIVAMVVLSLGVSVPTGGKDAVFAFEPRLRDRLLQVMFDHANIGGFSGNFTSAGNMRALRRDLLTASREILGDGALDILILDIVRQDV